MKKESQRTKRQGDKGSIAIESTWDEGVGRKNNRGNSQKKEEEAN